MRESIMNINSIKKAIFFWAALFLFSFSLFNKASAFTTITIMPGKLNTFRISVPHEVVAGRKFKIKIVALDDYGNVITDFAAKYEGLNVGVTIGNYYIEHLNIPASEFKNGVVSFNLSYKKAGKMNLAASFEGISNSSSPIKVSPGPFHDLKIVSPAKVTAGQPFNVKVYAADQYGNPVNFMPKGDIQVYLTGDNFKIRPRVIPSGYIKNGIGEFSFISDRAGISQLNFEAHYDGKSHVFISKNIDIKPSGFDKFLISTNISKVPAGRPFIIKIVSVDRYNNVIENINKTKGEVKLILISKLGIERSSVFGFKSFHKGVALVKTVFNRVGTFSIYAKPTGPALKKIKEPSKVFKNKIPAKSLLLYK